MFDQIPIRVWLLVLIAVLAWPPARYVYRHIVASPARRDISQPPQNLTWRSTASFLRNIILLGALFALALFIFTPFAERVGSDPQSYPILIAALAAWVLYTVIQGFLTGKIEPAIRGNFSEYDRNTQPKRFWSSLAWNAALGCGLLWGAYQINEDASAQVIEDRCFETEGSSPKHVHACKALIRDYDAAISREPNESYIRFNRALAYQQIGDRKRAIMGYGDAIRINPSNGKAYLNRGIAFLDTRKYAFAEADFTRSHELDPKNAWPLANRGITYAWMNDRARAENDFAAAKAIDPDNQVVARGEALLAMHAGNFERAAAILTTALSRDPKDDWARSMRAEAYRHLDGRRQSK